MNKEIGSRNVGVQVCVSWTCSSWHWARQRQQTETVEGGVRNAAERCWEVRNGEDRNSPLSASTRCCCCSRFICFSWRKQAFPVTGWSESSIQIGEMNTWDHQCHPESEMIRSHQRRVPMDHVTMATTSVTSRLHGFKQMVKPFSFFLIWNLNLYFFFQEKKTFFVYF